MKQPTPEDLRVAMARCGRPSYEIAALSKINPWKLSRLRSGKEPLTPEIFKRIATVCGAKD